MQVLLCTKISMNYPLDPHQAELLRRLREAEAVSQEKGEQRHPFHLIYASGGSLGLRHAGWDSSWLIPTAEDIDDLEELDLVRSEPPGNAKRVFALTVQGRRRAETLERSQVKVRAGRVPSLDEILRWLIKLDQKSSQHLAEPAGLPNKAVEDGLIDQGAEEVVAQRILDLVSQGFLEGEVLSIDQDGALASLQMSDDFRLTMRAHEKDKSQGSLNFYGSVVAGQIAAGSINNFVSFGDLLDRAEVEIQSLRDVADEDRDDALRLVEALRGKAVEASAGVLTGAGGGLLAGVLGQLIGLPSP